MTLNHLRTNLVSYLALAVALGTGTAYAATAIPNGSVTAAKLHTNAVTSTKIKNGTIRSKDLKKPTWVQSSTLVTTAPPTVPDVVSVAPYDFILPTGGRTSVTVFIPTIGGACDSGSPDQPVIGLYLDNVPIPNTAVTVPAAANDRSIQLTTTLTLTAGVHTARAGITCPGAPLPNVSSPGAKSWTIILTD